MGKVSDLLAIKGSAVHTIDAKATVLDAVRKMVQENVGSLIVMNGEAIHGIFTERDYLRRIVLEGRTSKATSLMDVTTERLVCVDPQRTVDECMSIMTAERIRHLPVIHAGRLAGMVSIGDLVRHLSKEREAEIRYLTDYIAGKYPG